MDPAFISLRKHDIPMTTGTSTKCRQVRWGVTGRNASCCCAARGSACRSILARSSTKTSKSRLKSQPACSTTQFAADLTNRGSRAPGITTARCLCSTISRRLTPSMSSRSEVHTCASFLRLFKVHGLMRIGPAGGGGTNAHSVFPNSAAGEGRCSCVVRLHVLLLPQLAVV